MGKALQLSDYFHGPSLYPLQELVIFPVLGAPDLDAILNIFQGADLEILLLLVLMKYFPGPCLQTRNNFLILFTNIFMPNLVMLQHL